MVVETILEYLDHGGKGVRGRREGEEGKRGE